jgi:hypothetical protein
LVDRKMNDWETRMAAHQAQMDQLLAACAQLAPQLENLPAEVESIAERLARIEAQLSTRRLPPPEGAPRFPWEFS